MPKLSNEKKLEALKEWLDKNDIRYCEKHRVGKGMYADLYIPKHHIMVRVGDSQDFFLLVRRFSYPIFIRESDTKALVLEKMQNTIIKSMTQQQERLNSKRNDNV